ncbi:VanZ family protein [Agromyces intestinalis]|uniref:VanZ family protein n=1 Tax=Agromyces intestinalis TaxID=2592652 RepID=A0A5C1YGH1_9MICO|nr:VanZ family protein [Agromyces intestinalis]QEO14179.1 VanZ family protein [Agromyces intestinalis]
MSRATSSASPARRPPRGLRAARIVLWALVAVAAVAVLAPIPLDAGNGGVVWHLLRVLRRAGLPGFVTYDVLEFIANVVLFVPVGALLALELPARRWGLAVAVAAAASVAIEAVQAIVLVARVSSIADVAANVVGALIGALIVRAVRRRGGLIRNPVRSTATSSSTGPG